MTQSAPSGSWKGPLLLAWLMICLTLPLAAALQHAYYFAQAYPFLRIDCLVAGIIAAVGMEFTLGGAMHYLDVALGARPRWYWVLLLVTKKRVLFIAQILVMALAVGAAGLMIFHLPIPGPDRSVLYPGWSPSSGDKVF